MKQNLTMFKATKASIFSIPEKKGIYYFYASLEGIQQLEQLCQLNFKPDNKGALESCQIDSKTYYLIYIGTAGISGKNTSNLKVRLSWHLNQKHDINAIQSGTLSTFRLGLAALLSNDLIENNTQDIVDNFFEHNCYFGFETIEDIHEIESKENSLINQYRPLLNIKNNPTPHEAYRMRRNLVKNNTLNRLSNFISENVSEDFEMIPANSLVNCIKSPNISEVILKDSETNPFKNEYFITSCSLTKSKNFLRDDNPASPLCFDAELKNYRKFMLNCLLYASLHTRKIKGEVENIQNYINLRQKAPAHMVYDGRFYKAAHAKDWNVSQRSKIYIISALFGIVNAADNIYFYDLNMNDILSVDNVNNGRGFTPKEFWKGKLDAIIEKIKSDHNAIIYNLLSDSYADIISASALTSANIEFGENDKINRLNKRGEWLAKRLEIVPKNTTNEHLIGFNDFDFINSFDNNNFDINSFEDANNKEKAKDTNFIFEFNTPKKSLNSREFQPRTPLKKIFLDAIHSIVDQAKRTNKTRFCITAKMVQEVSGIMGRLPACCNALRSVVRDKPNFGNISYQANFKGEIRDFTLFTICILIIQN